MGVQVFRGVQAEAHRLRQLFVREALLRKSTPPAERRPMSHFALEMPTKEHPTPLTPRDRLILTDQLGLGLTWATDPDPLIRDRVSPTDWPGTFAVR